MPSRSPNAARTAAPIRKGVSNYRGQFSKIIRTSSYADLVEKLKKKSDKIISPTP